MNIVAIIYFSGYGHTAKQAEAVAEGIRLAGSIAEVYCLTDQGDLPDGIYLGGYRSGRRYYLRKPNLHGRPRFAVQEIRGCLLELFERQAWKNKLAAGFTNSASISGDKFSTIAYFWTLAMQMGQIWVGTGLLPASKKTARQPTLIGLRALAELMQFRLQTLQSTKLRALAI